MLKNKIDDVNIAVKFPDYLFYMTDLDIFQRINPFDINEKIINEINNTCVNSFLKCCDF